MLQKHVYNQNFKCIQVKKAVKIVVYSPLVLILLFLVFLSGCKQKPGDTREKLPNILLIVADDLGKELGSYGDKNARTPSLDEFAQAYTKFANAYVTTASCSPSRSSR